MHRFLVIHRYSPFSSMLPYLQMYMGHARLSSTAYYIHLLPEHLVRAGGMNWKEIGDILPGVELLCQIVVAQSLVAAKFLNGF